MEINVAGGMSERLTIGVIITLRQGFNQHQTFASSGRTTTQSKPMLCVFSHSHLLSFFVEICLSNSIHTTVVSTSQTTVWLLGYLPYVSPW